MLAQEVDFLIFNLVKLPITEVLHVEKVCSPISFSLQTWAPFMPVLPVHKQGDVFSFEEQ